MPAAAVMLVGFGAYALASWRGRPVSASAAAGARGLPRVYTGRIPARVRRRSPAAVAAYELPMGVLGFPGVGWLFAGFPFQASILLLGGPALAWAVLPIAFSPYGNGPLRGVGWKLELVYLPVTALLSTAALYRAHRRRRLRASDHSTHRGAGAGAASTSARENRARRGALALVLVSLPFIAAVAGIGTSGVRYSIQPTLTPEVTGQFLVTPRGPVKLFSGPTLRPAIRATRCDCTRRICARSSRVQRRSTRAPPTSSSRSAATRPSHLRCDRAALARSRSHPSARSHRGGTSSRPRTRECSAAATTRT